MINQPQFPAQILRAAVETEIWYTDNDSYGSLKLDGAIQNTSLQKNDHLAFLKAFTGHYPFKISRVKNHLIFSLLTWECSRDHSVNGYHANCLTWDLTMLFIFSSKILSRQSNVAHFEIGMFIAYKRIRIRIIKMHLFACIPPLLTSSRTLTVAQQTRSVIWLISSKLSLNYLVVCDLLKVFENAGNH